ncbi:hypothetical protein L6R50_25500 [Myxococcota bacterium]|nr:hypothetical protein [Myxococcota bacterium]
MEDQRGFVLVFDHRFVFKEVPGGARIRVDCPDCRREVTMVEKQPYRQFILSWIPLWKVRQGPSCLECSSCQARFDVPDALRPGPLRRDADGPEV